MLVVIVLLHCYNQLNGYCDIYNNCDISVDYYRSTKFQYRPFIHEPGCTVTESV